MDASAVILSQWVLLLECNAPFQAPESHGACFSSKANCSLLLACLCRSNTFRSLKRTRRHRSAPCVTDSTEFQCQPMHHMNPETAHSPGASNTANAASFTEVSLHSCDQVNHGELAVNLVGLAGPDQLSPERQRGKCTGVPPNWHCKFEQPQLRTLHAVLSHRFQPIPAAHSRSKYHSHHSPTISLVPSLCGRKPSRYSARSALVYGA